MSFSRCLQLGTPVKVYWESLTQFPPPIPCVLYTAAAIKGNLPQTSDTVKNEANDNFADRLFRSEIETIVSVCIFMFLPSFMVLCHAANGSSGFVIVFVIHLCFSEEQSCVGTLSNHINVLLGTVQGLQERFAYRSQYSSVTGRWFIGGNKSSVFPGSPIAPRTVYKNVN